MVKILYFDIESAPNISYTWGKYEQDVLSFIREGYMLCYAYAWNDSKVKVVSLPDFETYKTDQTNDKELVESLWKLFDEADIIIAHNGKQFDIKYTNGRFLYHQLQPPKGYQVIDTLLVARSQFRLNSNKLGDLGKVLNLGTKLETGGFELWLGCMAGNEHAWSKMKKYNKQDVVLLRDVYYKVRGWIKNHPNVGLINEEPTSCPNCGGTHIQKKGFEWKGASKRQRLKCTDCGVNIYSSLKKESTLKS